MKQRVLIIGSCVSRDIFNFDKSNSLELVDYFARSSFASAFCATPVLDRYTERLSSPFQRRIVRADLSKSLSSTIEALKFDQILIDFIDERFKLFQFHDGSICTLSNELLNCGFESTSDFGRTVKSGSDDFFNLWDLGWSAFVEKLKRIGLLGRVRINKVFWADHTINGGDFAPSYSSKGIDEANKFLIRLYDRVAVDLHPKQFLDFSRERFVGAVDHRWGLSPFHYVDDYYREALRHLVFDPAGALGESASEIDIDRNDSFVASLTERPALLAERALEDWQEFSAIEYPDDPRRAEIDVDAVSGNCVVGNAGSHIEVLFRGEDGTYQFRLRLPRPFIGNGVSVRFRLRNWKSLRYVGVGYTHESVFRHVKITNAARNRWIDFSIGHRDLAFGLQNDWARPDACEIGDIRLYFKGTPSHEGAAVDVQSVWCWREQEGEVPGLDSVPGKVLAGSAASFEEESVVPAELLEVIYRYLNKCFRSADEQAKAFLSEGTCPLYGETALAWPLDSALPTDLASVGTYRFSWHALHPATILMVFSHNGGGVAPLFAAREFLTNWLERSYYQPDADKKFAWYDHGTAERLLAMVLMWAVGIQHKFDDRFMSRLRSAIFRHGQLLESELFYASHQPTRYHNHAWFQDLALMATALAMPDFRCSNRWLEIALARLTDQLDTLIVRDNGFAVFVENSIGYHQGVQRLVEFAGDLVSLTGRESHIPAIAKELSQFSDFLRYPDNRAPAQGDTFRRANASGADVRRIKAYADPKCVILPRAGYGIVKGDHEGIPYMLTVLATSLCRTHKHEDNLSFTLFFDGLEWLIDPSFYSHEYAAPVPAYLRSAVAHNALVILGRKYSIDPGVAILSGGSESQIFFLQGEHRAYEDIVVKRSLTGRIDRLDFDILDVAEAEDGFHGDNLCLMLHCGEQVGAELNGENLILSHPDSKYCLSIRLPSDNCRVLRGITEGDQIGGVTGHGFMQSTAINTVECRVPFGVRLDWKILAVSE